MTRDQAEEIARAQCREECRALLCERGQRCMALLYDTPGFCERIQELLARID
jgi:hypothetical protein